jgi:hypothetical protein
LLTLGHSVPTGPQWAYKIKHDGYRFVCRLEHGRVRVFSRRRTEYTDRVPRIVDTLARLPAASVTLDGEGVACDPTLSYSARRSAAPPSAKCFCMHSICLNSTAETCAANLGQTGVGSWRASCGVPVMASNCRITWTATMARPFFGTPAQWGSKGLSPSGVTSRIAPAGRHTGSRSRTRTHPPRRRLIEETQGGAESGQVLTLPALNDAIKSVKGANNEGGTIGRSGAGCCSSAQRKR